MTGDLFEIPRARRDAGMSAAATHADRVHDGWTAAALERVKAAAQREETLTCESVRQKAESDGFPQPPDKRAWGRVMQMAAKSGWVKSTDRFIRSADPKVHMSRLTIWESLLFKGAA